MVNSSVDVTIKVLHYLSPFMVVGYFAGSSLWSVCALQEADEPVRKRLKRAILIIMGIIAACYAGEAVLTIYQIFTGGGPWAKEDNNVFVLSGILVWTFITACEYKSEKHLWYPYYGSWALACAFEATACVLRLVAGKPTSAIEWGQLILKLNRIFDMAMLIVIYFWRRHQPQAPSDEETTPLLAGLDAHDHETPQNANSEENAVSEALEREEAKRDKKRKERQDKFEEKLREHNNWFTYLRKFLIFFPFIWPTKNPKLLWNMGGVGVCLVLERVLNVLGPRQLGILVNSMNVKDASGAFGALMLYVFFNFLNSSAGVRGIHRFLWVPVEGNARRSLDVASYDKIMELSCEFHDNKQSGELFTQMRQGASVVSLLETCLYELGPMVADLIIALFYFWVLFDSYLVLIAAATVGAYFWTSMFITALQVTIRRKQMVTMRRKYQYQYDTMSSWRTVTYFNQIPHVERMYAASVDRSMAIWTRSSNIYNFGSGFKGLVLDLGSMCAYAFAVYQVVFNGKDVGSFMVLLTYWGRFSSPLQVLASTQKEVLDDLVDAEELRSLFERQPSVVDGKNELYMDKAEVTFEDVSFTYESNKDSSKETIDGLSFHAGTGKKIALIGETGAGKSTAFKLLFRLYDCTKGKIMIDGQDIKDVTLRSLRDEIGVVPQDPSLFNDTILANLRFGKTDITMEEAIEACKAAAVHEQILKFPDGYSSVVGERGVKLSGGEKQRIAIARAILKRPKLILLDEATSSVDNETEEMIQEGLARLCEGRTTIVIAHRLSTIMDADLILVLKDGKILEQGTPKELLRRKGKYYSLWSKQVGIIDALNEEEEKSKLQVEGSFSPRSSRSQLLSNTDGAADSNEKGLPNESSSETATGDSDETANVSEADSPKDTENKADQENLIGDLPAQTQSIQAAEAPHVVTSSEVQSEPATLTAERDGTSNTTTTHPTKDQANASAQTTTSLRGGAESKQKFRPEAPEFVPRSTRSAAVMIRAPQTPPPKASLPASSAYGTGAQRQFSGTSQARAAQSGQANKPKLDCHEFSALKENERSTGHNHANSTQGPTRQTEPLHTSNKHVKVITESQNGNDTYKTRVMWRRPHETARGGISKSEPTTNDELTSDSKDTDDARGKMASLEKHSKKFKNKERRYSVPAGKKSQGRGGYRQYQKQWRVHQSRHREASGSTNSTGRSTSGEWMLGGAKSAMRVPSTAADSGSDAEKGLKQGILGSSKTEGGHQPSVRFATGS